MPALGVFGGHAKWGYKVDNLYVQWNFGLPKSHICFLGHMDVVPVGDINLWCHDPFGAAEDDEFIYGRGTTDMRGAIAAWLGAITGVGPRLSNCTISMLITCDEEWAAVNGSDKVLQWMLEQGIAPDYFVVGEPSSPELLATNIKIGRRGSLCGTIEAKGIQGHAAYPSLYQNPNRALALGMSILQCIEFHDSLEYFPASQFQVIALQSGDFAASAIVPAKAMALWNIRFTHRQTPEGLQSLLKKCLDEPPAWAQAHPDAELINTILLTANIDTASLPYYSEPRQLARAAMQSIERQLGIVPCLDGEGGTTDARFIQRYFPCSEIIELGLPESGGLTCKHAEYSRIGGMHQVDERCRKQDVANLEAIYEDIIKGVSTI